MFKQIEYMMQTKRILRSWGGNPRALNLDELIILSPTILLNSISKKSEYFSNRYVQSDALVIIVTYAAYIMKITGAPQSVIDDLENKTLCVLQDVFSLSPAISKMLFRNRFSYFTKIISRNEEDVTPMIEESVFVFANDLHYDEYFPYSNDSKKYVLPFQEQYMLKAETMAYFKQVLGFTNDTFSKYFNR